MRITSVTPFVVHPGWRKNWVFVRLATDDKIVGWGEAYTQYDRDAPVLAQIEELGRYVVGRDPFNIKHFTQMAFDDFAKRRGSMELFSAISAVEMALWDIVGKVLEQPVWRLLGGAYRDRVRVYANGWSYHLEDPNDYAKAAKQVIEQGFTAMKFDPVPGGRWRHYIPKRHESHAVEVVAAVREAVGPDVDLLLDLHRRLAPMHAIRLAARLEEYSPYWMEEPCPAENVAALAEVRAATEIPIVTGETLYTKTAFFPVLEGRAVDIINPDVCSVGGILELREIAAMAEPCFVAVSPHNYNSTVLALSATVHAAAAMPNFIITEYFLPFAEFGRKVAPDCLVPEDGYIGLPETSGLGLTIDEAVIEASAGKRYDMRSLPHPSEEVF